MIVGLGGVSPSCQSRQSCPRNARAANASSKRPVISDWMIRMNKIHRQPIHTLDPRAPHYTLVFGRVAPILSIPIILSKKRKSIKRILKSASDFRLDDQDEQDSEAALTFEPRPAACEGHDSRSGRRFTILSIPAILPKKCTGSKRILKAASDFRLHNHDEQD